MALYHAEKVDLSADADYGEGWIIFQWPDRLFGWECLTLNLDDYCARRMPIRMGGGMPEFIDLQRDRIRMRFDPDLAAKLEFEQDVEITFNVSDEDYRELCKVISYLKGE
jgi:hypothetical protein